MRQYQCATCHRALTRSGTGLGTWTCPDHPERLASVIKDLTGGKEESLKRGEHQVGCVVRRHTEVRVVKK
jgi:hypothetical protein